MDRSNRSDQITLRVLLVEDDPAMRTFMRVVLQNEPNVEVTLAEDGEQALQAFANAKPDLILLDLFLPGISGLQVLKSIRDSLDGDEWLPIIAISGMQQDDAPLQAFRQGADDFMLKPVNKEILQRKLRSFRRGIFLQRQNDQLLSQLTAVTDDVNVGLITTDKTGIVNWCNPSANSIFGATRSSIEGLHMSYLVEDMMNFDFDLCTMEGASKIDDVLRLRMMATRDDGSQFPVEISASRLRVKSEAMCSIELRDLTEMERVENMKREFLSVINHELRTPLTSINGALSILQSGKLGEMSPKAAQMINLAHRNGQRLYRLINDILDFEKMEEGKLEIHLQPQSLNTLLGTSIKAMDAFAKSEQIELSTRLSEDELSARVDPDRFEQVVTNLVSNAVKFSEKGQGVEVRLSRKGDNPLVEVEDHGCGISDEFTTRIFNRFSQAETSDTRTKVGSGLGLAICKKLVEAMGGSIGYQSSEGKGTTFYFHLPLILETCHD